jgi:iron uptake system component EfeO
MTRRALAASAAVTALALALTGCVAKADLASAITVDITDDGCSVAVATAPAGAVAFALANNGTDVNEFEILADDQLRIVGEKENVTPGQEIDFTAQLEPGTYYTACKFQQVGAPIGLAEFTVTGEVSAVSAGDQELSEQAVTEYLAYVRSQSAELLPLVVAFAAA